MAVTCRRYDHARDFLRVRDLLVETYGAFPRPLNWRIERWNYCHCFAAPYLADLGLPGVSKAAYTAAVRAWHSGMAVWEDGAGRLLGLVHTEDQRPGPAYIQRRPEAEPLLPEMLDHVEARLAVQHGGTARAFAYAHDQALLALLRARGYEADAAHPEHDAEFVIGELPPPTLPPGYALRSMAEENDLARRGKAFGLGFNHPDPRDWPSAATYRLLQAAPDYDPSLDLYVVAPDGEFVSFCIIWHDARNRLGSLEPVGTHPDHRRRGLGRAVVLEGVRRVAARGAERVWVGSNQEFYRALGFAPTLVGHVWSRAG